jgi:type II restriction enzyme
MKQSTGLRNRLTGNVKNIKSKKQDNHIKNVTEEVLQNVNEIYHNYQFGIDGRIMLRDLEKIVNGSNLSTSKITSIKPDGGFLWIKINGKKHYILIPEQKHQGTNDQRLLEGKSVQAKGNAVERLGKNLIGCETLFLDEDIFPFVVFLQGCDFCDDESTIGDRVRTIFRFLPSNTINLFYKGRSAGSYFMRGHSMKEMPGTSDWTNEEMFEIMFTIAKTSIEYYLEKYGE